MLAGKLHIEQFGYVIVDIEGQNLETKQPVPMKLLVFKPKDSGVEISLAFAVSDWENFGAKVTGQSIIVPSMTLLPQGKNAQRN